MAKLRETTTWETLCDEKKPILYPSITFPIPPVSFAVEPKSKGDEEKITISLARLCEEDPTIKLQRDEQTKADAFSSAWARFTWKSRWTS